MLRAVQELTTLIIKQCQSITPVMPLCTSTQARNFSVVNVRVQPLQPRNRFLCSDAAHKSGRKLSSLSDEEADIVLHIMNTSSETGLAKFKYVSKRMARVIMEERSVMGTYSCLTEIPKLQGVGLKSFQKAVKSILNNEMKETEEKLSSSGRLLHPRLLLDEVPEKVVACHIEQNSISWAALDAHLQLEDWNVEILHERIRPNYDHALCQEKVMEAYQAVPKGDLYLLEDISTKADNTQALISRFCIEATLMTLFNQENIVPKDQQLENAKLFHIKHKVHKINQAQVGSYFGLMVGSHRTSCQPLVEAMARGACPAAEGVQIPFPAMLHFRNMRPVLQEYLARCLLQSVAFYKLVVHRKQF